jgi:uncharacterized coiled-coil protein SlyX
MEDQSKELIEKIFRILAAQSKSIASLSAAIINITQTLEEFNKQLTTLKRNGNLD